MAGLLGSGARVGVAAWGRAGCWPRGVSAPATASPAAASMLGRPAPARCPMLGRCPSPGPNAGSVASSATWSARPAKVPGGNPLGTAIPGPRRVRRLLARAAALRRARAPGRREGRFVYRERKGIRDFPLLSHTQSMAIWVHRALRRNFVRRYGKILPTTDDCSDPDHWIELVEIYRLIRRKKNVTLFFFRT